MRSIVPEGLLNVKNNIQIGDCERSGYTANNKNKGCLPDSCVDHSTVYKEQFYNKTTHQQATRSVWGRWGNRWGTVTRRTRGSMDGGHGRRGSKGSYIRTLSEVWELGTLFMGRVDTEIRWLHWNLRRICRFGTLWKSFRSCWRVSKVFWTRRSWSNWK